VSKVELACDADEYGDLLPQQRQHRNSRLFLSSQLKLALQLCASHCHLEARDPWSSRRATPWRES